PAAGPADPAGQDPLAPRTLAWGTGAASDLFPSLVELVASGNGNRTILSKSESWIGSHPECAICRALDPFVEQHHVRLFRDAAGWHAENNSSRNGLWFRVPQVTVSDMVLFQIGEQRLRLKVGG